MLGGAANSRCPGGFAHRGGGDTVAKPGQRGRGLIPSRPEREGSSTWLGRGPRRERRGPGYFRLKPKAANGTTRAGLPTASV
jgi:hypothetical protein